MKRLYQRYKAKLEDRHFYELVKGSADFFGYRVVGLAAHFLFIYFVNRFYGAAALGIFSLSLVCWTIVSLYGRFGLDNALVKYTAEFQAKNRPDLVKKVYWMSLWVSIPVSLVSSAILYILAPFLAHHVFSEIINKEAMITGIRLMAYAVTPGVIIYLNAAALRGRKRLKGYSFLINVAQYIVGTVILVAVVLTWGKTIPRKEVLPITIFTIATAISAFISFGFKPVPGQFKTGLVHETSDSIAYGKLMRVSFPMLLSGSYTLLLTWTSTLVLGIYRPEADVGIYHVVTKVAAILTFTLTAVNSISASKFSESYSTGDMEAFTRVTSYCKRLIFWTTVPIGIVLFLFPRPIIGLFGNGIKEGARALTLILIGYFINAISGPVGTILLMTKHQVAYQNIILSGAIVNIVLSFILIPSYGIEGASVASSVGMTIWNIVSVFYVKKKFNIWTLYFPFLRRKNKKHLQGDLGV